jgi:hypothetical protein
VVHGSARENEAKNREIALDVLSLCLDALRNIVKSGEKARIGELGVNWRIALELVNRDMRPEAGNCE